MKTVVGLFSTTAEAERVKTELVTEGFETGDIKVMANGTDEGAGSSTGQGVGEKISSFFHSLTGGDEDTHHHYARGVNEGGALVAVTVDDEEATDVAELLQEFGARNIDGGYTGEASSGTPVYGSGSTGAGTLAEGTTIPIVEEELLVGKREVDRGGVRVYSHVTEMPVSEDISLREERVRVERRPVDRPATAADFEAGRGSVIELNATGEEAIVGKTSRVVEEVVIGKQSSAHTETIHDSVRRTEVDVEELEPALTEKSRY